MWTKIKSFITGVCLLLAPYIDACRFGAPKARSGINEVREGRCTRIRQ